MIRFITKAAAGLGMLALAGAVGVGACSGGTRSWSAGPGGKAALQVARDVTQGLLGHVSPAQLQTDARNAAALPPPKDASQYVSGMKDIAEAGHEVATGNETLAVIHLEEGNALVKVAMRANKLPWI